MAKFAHFGDLYWSTTWRLLFFCPMDLPVIDLSWKVAHGAVFTAARLCHFGYNVSLGGDPRPVYCPLAQSGISWLQSLLFRCTLLSPVFECRHLLFGFGPDELRVLSARFCVRPQRTQVFHLAGTERPPFPRHPSKCGGSSGER